VILREVHVKVKSRVNTLFYRVRLYYFDPGKMPSYPKVPGQPHMFPERRLVRT